jgi:pyruvate dehydrogenase E1 component alpha subunit
MDDCGVTPKNSDSLNLFEKMLLIRRAEETLAVLCKQGKLPGAVHLYVGQEAIAVGACSALTNQDWITSTHRGHGHFLAKGGNLQSMYAEIWGKREGICKGMGGSMHVADFSKGILGANGIVGGGFAIATGAAFGAQLRGEGQVALCFFGDGAANQGVFMESMNISSVWKLPTVFLCENNGVSEFTVSSTVTAMMCWQFKAKSERQLKELVVVKALLTLKPGPIGSTATWRRKRHFWVEENTVLLQKSVLGVLKRKTPSVGTKPIYWHQI